jgi:hypothetical protein
MTYFTGPLEVGTAPDTNTVAGKGYGVLAQTVLIDFVAEAAAGSDNVDATLTLPANAQILAFYTDTLTAWDSVTSAGLTIGSAAGGTQYNTSVDVKSAGREAPTLTAAQLAAMDDIGTNTTVHIRVAQVGNTTAGQARVTCLYAMK